MAGRKEIVDAVATSTGRSKSEVAAILDATLGAIVERLQRGERVQLSRFGSFSVSQRAARLGRNPATDQPLTIPASKTVRFKTGAELRDTLNS